MYFTVFTQTTIVQRADPEGAAHPSLTPPTPSRARDLALPNDVFA